MNNINGTISRKLNNVYVDKDINNNVYFNVDDIEKINIAIDKHKAVGELLAEKLSKPQNVKFYIKLSYLNQSPFLLEWAAIALDAHKNGKASDLGKYFYGIVKILGG